MLSSVLKLFQVIFLVILSGQCGTSHSKTKKELHSHKIYQPTWESLDQRPLPEWYDDAKVGIFIHWGLYSVPSYGSEWFWYYLDGTKLPNYVDFVRKNYKPGFTYQEFAKDFTAELFDAKQWAKLFEDSGAKYVVLTSKHHEGYTLWPSSRSFSWNSRDIGPNRDIIKELSTAIKTQTSLKFGLYYSLYEWFNKLYIADKQKKFRSQTYVRTKVLPELQELIFRYKPEILWSDGDQEAYPEYWNATEFIAWLYNTSPVRKTVVTNDRWGKGVMCAHGDFYTCADRYNPGVLQPHKWENAFTIDKTTWGHRFDTTLKDYMTSMELIKELVITISCGGNVLVNIGPTRHGTIEPIFEERLRLMGTWLKMNGEAIYGSRPWIYQNDTETPGVWYTKKDEQSDRINVYAMILEYPYETNKIELYALGGQLDDKSTVELISYPNADLFWYDNSTFLYIEFPPKNLIDNMGLKLAYTFKVNIPAAT